MKKLISVICVLAMLAGVISTVAYAADAGKDYTIVNPYADVDWSWEQYKTDLHTHTNASDGDDTLKDMLEVNYDYGFDIYAVSDHGTVNYSWTNQQPSAALKLFCAVKEGYSDIVDLDGEGTATNGNRYTVLTENDSDYYTQTYADGTKGQRMLRVPYANEQNPTSLNNAHVNTWFVDYGHGVVGGTSDYETPIKAVDELGGLSVINHPGEYTNARDEECTADAYNYDDTLYKYYIDKFTSILSKYDSCIGIDVNSKGDGRTRFDRKLWDILLMNLAPTGRNVNAIATSDAHSIEAAFTGYTLMLMPENTVDSLYNCMDKGEFLAASRCLGNHDELKEIATYLVTNGDAEAAALGQSILDAQAEDYNYQYEAAYDFAAAPQVNSIDVNDADDSIAINVDGDLCIRWIADGKTIGYGDTIDLDDYSDEIGSYVRAEIFGEGGIVYTQAFLLEYDGAPEAELGEFTDYWWVASTIPDTIVKLLGSLPIWEVIWSLIK